MDLGFFRRAQQGFDNRSTAALDYGVLVATLAAVQSTSATARAEALCGRSAAAPAQDPLVEILTGGAGWRDAIAAQGGCFSRGQSLVKGLSMQMTAPFTTAF